MMRRLFSVIAALGLGVLPLAAQAQEDFAAVILALPDPLPLASIPGCLMTDPALASAADPAILARYIQPFDMAAADSVLAYLSTAIAAAPASGVQAPGPDDFGGALPADALTENYNSLGLDPANVIDVATLYLVMVWAAQEGDIGILTRLEPDHLAAVKAEVLAGELRCANLIGQGDDLAGLRNRMVAMTGLLVDGLEAHSRSGQTDAFAAVVRDRLGRQVEGLVLTPEGFVKP